MKRARERSFLGDSIEATKKFSPFKDVLGALPAFFANREVRLSSPAHNSPLTDTSFRGLLPQEKRSSSFSLVYLHWKCILICVRPTWQSKGAGRNQ